LRQALILTRAKRHRAYPQLQFFEALMAWEPTVRPGRVPACSLPLAAVSLHAEKAAANSSEAAKVATLSEIMSVGEAVALAALQAVIRPLHRYTTVIRLLRGRYVVVTWSLRAAALAPLHICTGRYVHVCGRRLALTSSVTAVTPALHLRYNRYTCGRRLTLTSSARRRS
jgi:hypothetical protein